MKPRWILLSLFASLILAFLVHLYQLSAVWAVNLKADSELLCLHEQTGTIFTDESDEQHIYPSTIVKRSLHTGQQIGQAVHLKSDLPWNDYTGAQISPDQKFLVMYEELRRDGRTLVALHDLESGKQLKEWSLKECPSQSITFSCDSQHLLLGESDSTYHFVRICNLKTLQERQIQLPKTKTSWMYQLMSCNAGNSLAVLIHDNDCRMHLFDMKQAIEVGKFSCWSFAVNRHSNSSIVYLEEANDDGNCRLIERDFSNKLQTKRLDNMVFQSNPLRSLGIKYRFRDSLFDSFSRRLASDSNGGLGLERYNQPRDWQLWFNEHVMDLSLFQTAVQLYWLDFESKELSQPVSLLNSYTHLICQHGVLHQDNYDTLRFTRYPSQHRWIATLAAGLAIPILLVFSHLIRRLPRKSKAA